MKHAPGQWTITVDHTAEEGAKPGTNANAVGMIGPRTATMTAAEILAHADSRRFRMTDDDGEAFYEGVCYLPEGLTEDAFAPKDDFGEPNAGATEIYYWNADWNDGQWEQL
jgi:hypothetical protein